MKKGAKLGEYCIYVHVNKLNKKVYVGLTNNVKRRWRGKGLEYKPHNFKSSFWNALQKYGWDNFEHVILESGLTQEEAIEKERFYIKKYNSTNKCKGYNISEGGNGGKIYKVHPKGMLGKNHSEEKKTKQRELMKKLNEQGKTGKTWKNGHPKGMLGKKHTEEYKQKLRDIPTHKHPSAMKVEVKFPNGEIKIFDSVKYAKEFYGLSDNLMCKLLKNEKPYEIPKANIAKDVKEKLEKIVGLTFRKYRDKQEA